MPTQQPTSEEHQHLLEENDALRLELVHRDQIIASKGQTIDQLQLAERAKSKRMEELRPDLSWVSLTATSRPRSGT
jgi:hypothetical protein